MAIVPISVIFRGPRRVRSIFSGALASGAFTTLGMYSITADDGGTNPLNIVALFAITNTASAVEFAVDSDLTSGALYTIGFTAVPGADLSTFTGTVDSRVGLELTAQVNVEPERDDLNLLLYQRDLVFSGNDIQEDATGDLLSVSGRPNWKGAINRRVFSVGLPWDPTYGPEAEQSVDAPAPYAPAFGASVASQARLDDRTKQAVVQVIPAPGDPAGFIVQAAITAKDDLATMTVPIPVT